MANRWSEDYYFEMMGVYAAELPPNTTPAQTVVYCQMRFIQDGQRISINPTLVHQS